MAPLAAKTEVPRHIDLAKKARVVKRPTVEAEALIDTRIFIPAPEPREDIYGLPEIYDPPTTAMDPTRTRRVPPVPSPDRFFPRPSQGSAFPMAALTFGGVSLAVATVSAGMASDDPTDGAIIFSGVMAGVSIAAFAVGGIVYLIEAGDEGTRVGVGPGSLVLDGSF
jgi:hypothetical protein